MENQYQELQAECERLRAQCGRYASVIMEWLASSPTNKDGKYVSFFANRAHQAVLRDREGNSRYCVVCSKPGHPCVYCANGICHAAFCSQHKHLHEKCDGL